MVEQRKSIVYIEDDPDLVDLVKLILGSKDFAVIGAYSGQVGLELVKNNPPDLILLDLMMPDIDGWEVFKRLKADEFTSQIPIVIISAKAQPIDQLLGLSIARADDYISKPFHPQQLIDSVQKVLSRKQAPR